MTCSCLGALGTPIFCGLSKKQRFLEAVKKGSDFITTEYLLAHPQLIASVTVFGSQNALHLSAENGHLHLICSIVESLCQIFSASKGNSVFKDSHDIMRFINSQDVKGHTPLLLAVRNGHVHCARQLLASGADCTLLDKSGSSALHYGAAYGKVSLLNALLQEFRNNEENFRNVRVVDIKNLSGFSPLHYAVWCKNIAATRFLLQYGADITAQNAASELDPLVYCCCGSTPLHIAAAQSQPEIARLILKAHYERSVEPFIIRGQEPEAQDPRTIPNQEGKLPYQVARALGARNLATLLHPQIAWSGLFAGMESHPRFYGPRPLKALAARAVNKQLLLGLDILEARIAQQKALSEQQQQQNAFVTASKGLSKGSEPKQTSRPGSPALTTSELGKKGTWSFNEQNPSIPPQVDAKSAHNRADSCCMDPLSPQTPNVLGASVVLSGDPWEEEQAGCRHDDPNSNSGWRSRWPFRGALHSSLKTFTAYTACPHCGRPNSASHSNTPYLAPPCSQCPPVLQIPPITPPSSALNSPGADIHTPVTHPCAQCGTAMVPMAAATDPIVRPGSGQAGALSPPVPGLLLGTSRWACPNEDCMSCSTLCPNDFPPLNMPELGESMTEGGAAPMHSRQSSPRRGPAAPPPAAPAGRASSSYSQIEGVGGVERLGSGSSGSKGAGPSRRGKTGAAGVGEVCVEEEGPEICVPMVAHTVWDRNSITVAGCACKGSDDGAGLRRRAGAKRWGSFPGPRRQKTAPALHVCSTAASITAAIIPRPFRPSTSAPDRHSVSTACNTPTVAAATTTAAAAAADSVTPVTAPSGSEVGDLGGVPPGQRRAGALRSASAGHPDVRKDRHPFAVVSAGSFLEHPDCVHEQGAAPAGDVQGIAGEEAHVSAPLVRTMSLTRGSKSGPTPTVMSDADDSEVQEDEEGEECGVCMEQVAALQLQPCGHHLCLPCVRRLCSMRSTRMSICPFCRHLIGGFGGPKGVTAVHVGHITRSALTQALAAVAAS